MTNRTISSVVDLPISGMRPGLKIRHLAGAVAASAFDPFLQTDVFEMSNPAFPPHPHAGFSAVTYILPESETGFRNRDSLGHDLTIAPGSLHWTSAGSGVHHEEVPLEQGKTAKGLQIFVNLAASKKRNAPEILHVATPDVPVVEKDGATIRVVVGASNGVQSPLVPPTSVRLIDVRLDPNARFSQELEVEENAVLLVLEGAINVAGTQIGQGQVAASDTSSETLEAQAAAQGARFILFAGQPLREPVVANGPFIAESREAMNRVIADYQTGRMGHLASVA